MKSLSVLLILIVPETRSFPARTLSYGSQALHLSAASSWSDIESLIGSSCTAPRPVSIDSVLQPGTPTFSKERPTFFRERHGWCPYSERVWSTLELKSVEYDTVLIDNTGGGRPSYFGGTTPQMKWPDGRMQGESMDLVRKLDAEYNPSLFDASNVDDCIDKFSRIFPRARPSSRAAFLFQYNGEPLWRGVFEDTLQKTDTLLSQTEGPFFCGSQLSAADVAWAPFLERYRYQLPCLHEGLEPYSPETYPDLHAWYNAMDRVPEYACRVKGDASSWRKVLLMAGFGNAGTPPQVEANMDSLMEQEALSAKSIIDEELWKGFASTRPYLAATPQAEAAATILNNRKAIALDVLKVADRSRWKDKGLPTTDTELDEVLRAMVCMLLDDYNDDVHSTTTHAVGALAGFLDERMCVPRDMGAMSAASIKQLAHELVA